MFVKSEIMKELGRIEYKIKRMEDVVMLLSLSLSHIFLPS